MESDTNLELIELQLDFISTSGRREWGRTNAISLEKHFQEL